MLVARDQRLDALILNKLDISGAAPAQGCNEQREPVLTTPDCRPVDLHLLARCRLEPHHGLGHHDRPQRRDIRLYHRIAADISSLTDLAQQHLGRNYIG
jgi:hypothetical protein